MPTYNQRRRRQIMAARDERPIGRITGERPGTWIHVRIDYRTALFAVHHDVKAITHYTVTHGLTGKAVVRGLSREIAIRTANALQERPELWRFTDAPSQEARRHLMTVLGNK